MPPSRTLVITCTTLITVAAFSCCLGGRESIPIGTICTSDGECGELICSYGRCRSPCVYDRDCQGLSCVPSASDPTIRVCTLQEETCALDADCPDGLICAVDGQCREACDTDDDCVDDRECFDGACLERGVLADAGLFPDADVIDSGADDVALETTEASADVDDDLQDVGLDVGDALDGDDDAPDSAADSSDADALDSSRDVDPNDVEDVEVDAEVADANDIELRCGSEGEICRSACCLDRNTCDVSCGSCPPHTGVQISCSADEDCPVGGICCSNGTTVLCVATEEECTRECTAPDGTECPGSNECCAISPESDIGVCRN